MSESQFEVNTVVFTDQRSDKIKVMICQLDFDQMRYKKDSRLLFVSSIPTNNDIIRRYLNIALAHRVDLIVFPELSIPEDLIKELASTSQQSDMYIIGGTHYKKTDHGYISICPIITPHGVYETEKINPAPVEMSSFKDGAEGTIPGHKVMLFKGTKVGDFAVNICLDYTNDKLREQLEKDKLDLLIVSAFNNKSEEFFFSMHSDVQRSSSGLYVLYSNAYSKSLNIEGRSALFAFVDEVFKSEFLNKKRTDTKFPNKIYELSADKSYCIIELDLKHKKPFKGRNGYTETNVKVIEEDNADIEKRYEFLETIKVHEERYKYIDQYYVKPREYEEMKSLLENDNVLVITGDPGIGKTYTAIHFLREYFMKGFKPVWILGMEKEDREKQKLFLSSLEPEPNQIVYIEDPFGKTVFENREELLSLFSNLPQKFRASKAKLIITSRAEVFKLFRQESMQEDELHAFEKVMNVRKPSYEKDELITIANHYIEAYANWRNKKAYVSAIVTGINEGKLYSPLMIYNIVRNNAQVSNVKILKSAVNNASSNLIIQFAQEIRQLSIPTKILLYMVFLRGLRKMGFKRELFQTIQAILASSQSFSGSTFDFELLGQEGYRIQRIEDRNLSYRFSHPAYEEAVASLAMNDQLCRLVFDTVFKELLRADRYYLVAVVKHYVYRYPLLIESVLRSIPLPNLSFLSEEEIIELTWGLISSTNSYLNDVAKTIYPMNRLLPGLYSNDLSQRFHLRLRILLKRKDELCEEVEWQRVFSLKMKRIHSDKFVKSYRVAASICPNLIDQIKDIFDIVMLAKMFIGSSTIKVIRQLEEILSRTCFNGILSEFMDLFPDYIIGGKRQTTLGVKQVVKKYLLYKGSDKGCIIFDDGTTDSILGTCNLYPVGVEDVIGDFEKGDVVFITTKNGKVKARTVVEMSSFDVRRYKKKRSPDIYELNDHKKVNTIISRSEYRANIEKSLNL